MAGVHSVFQAMVASVMPRLTGGAPLISRSIRLEMGEGDIAGPLGQIAAQFPDVSIGSYPYQLNGVYGANIVLRSANEAMLQRAIAEMTRVFPHGV